MSCGFVLNLSKYPDPKNPAVLRLGSGLTLPWIQTGQVDRLEQSASWWIVQMVWGECKVYGDNLKTLSRLTSKVLFQWYNNTKVKGLFALSAEHDQYPSQAKRAKWRHLALRLKKNIKSLSYFTDFSVQMCKQLKKFIEGVCQRMEVCELLLFILSQRKDAPKSSETWKIMFLFEILCLPTTNNKYLHMEVETRE